MVDPEAEMDGVVVRRWKVLYRVAMYAEMSQDRQTITLSGASADHVIAQLRWQYPPDSVDVISVMEVE